MQMEESFDRLEAGTLESPNDLEILLPRLIADPGVHLRRTVTVPQDRTSGPEIRPESSRSRRCLGVMALRHDGAW